jgi:hypothetical protein
MMDGDSVVVVVAREPRAMQVTLGCLPWCLTFPGG